MKLVAVATYYSVPITTTMKHWPLSRKASKKFGTSHYVAVDTTSAVSKWHKDLKAAAIESTPPQQFSELVKPVPEITPQQW